MKWKSSESAQVSPPVFFKVNTPPFSSVFPNTVSSPISADSQGAGSGVSGSPETSIREAERGGAGAIADDVGDHRVAAFVRRYPGGAEGGGGRLADRDPIGPEHDAVRAFGRIYLQGHGASRGKTFAGQRGEERRGNTGVIWVKP